MWTFSLKPQIYTRSSHFKSPGCEEASFLSAQECLRQVSISTNRKKETKTQTINLELRTKFTGWEAFNDIGLWEFCVPCLQIMKNGDENWPRDSGRIITGSKNNSPLPSVQKYTHLPVTVSHTWTRSKGGNTAVCGSKSRYCALF